MRSPTAATSSESGTGRAFAWRRAPFATFDLADPAAFPLNPPPPNNVITLPKVAYGVSDLNPPVAVGNADGLWRCDCPPEGVLQGGTSLGFRVVLQTGSMLNALPPVVDPANNNCDTWSQARDVNTSSLTAGRSKRFALPQCADGSSVCADGEAGVVWQPASAVELDDLGPESEGRGNNDFNQIVGYGWQPDDPCQVLPLFWQNYLAVHEVLPVDPPIQRARAEAINNPDPAGVVRVVGTNETQERALLWEKPAAGTTLVYDVDNLIVQCWNGSGPSHPSSDWDIFRAYDINDSGWIIAVGDADPQTDGIQEAHAILLAPLSSCPPDICDGDINGDGTVAVYDFLQLLEHWGACPSSYTNPCRWDLDCDGVVGVVDFLQLLGEWGPCGMPTGGPPQTVQDCIDRFGLEDPEVLEKCICAVEPQECPEP